MTILALEFSPQERSAALLMDGKPRGFAIGRALQGIHSFDLIQTVLDEAGIHTAHVECMAVGLGPGSYAGIRTAIAVATGWQLARGIKLLGISSAEAIARKINTSEAMFMEGQTSFQGVANLVFDAQQDQAYAVRYQIGTTDPLVLGTFDLLTRNEEMRRRKAGEIFVKGDMGAWQRGNETVILSDARAIGEIASQKAELGSERQLEPVYLRKTDFVKASPPKFIT